MLANYKQALKLFTHPSVITMLFLGFSAGIPILLIFSTLGLWLNEAGVTKSSITYFSWAALGYSFKFVWAPLVDRLPIPFLTHLLGRRRSWMLLSQLAIMGAILLMSSVDPIAGASSLEILAYGAVLLGFSSATQDIVIDAYRIESADADLQSMLSATYIAGYRIGMLVAGAGGLFLASELGSTKTHYSYDAWSMTYVIMALIMLIGIITTLLISEPESSKPDDEAEYSTTDYARFFLLFLSIIAAFIFSFILTSDLIVPLKKQLNDVLSNEHLSGFFIGSLRIVLALFSAYLMAKILIMFHVINQTMVSDTYIAPVKDFFNRYGVNAAVLLLSIIGLYRVSDIVLGVVANIFYQDIGFTKIEIATIAKTFGLFMTLAGGFLGGFIAIKTGVFKVLFLGAFLSALTNLLFIVLANVGHEIAWLYVTIAMDNLAAGLAGAAFVAFLSSLTNIKFTAVQYAIFSSLMTLFPKIFGGYSGTLIEQFGYEKFFMLTTLLGIPVLWLVWKAKVYIK